MFSTIPPVGVPFDWRTIFSDNDSEGIFARELATRLNGTCTLVSSGKAALWLALTAMHELRPDRNEVILPDYTCWTVPSAVMRAGLKAKPIDLESKTLGIDPACLPESISDKTLAVIAPHLFGVPCCIDEIESMCAERGVYLIDDAAQAFGTVLNGKVAGSFGDVGILSFGRGKNITTGNGGALIVRGEQLQNKVVEIAKAKMPQMTSTPVDSAMLLAYKVLFSRYLFWLPSSLPFLKLGETVYDTNFDLGLMAGDRAGRGARQLLQYSVVLALRQRVASAYRERLAGAKGLNLTSPAADAVSADLRFPVILADQTRRPRILEDGKKYGISAMYPDTVTSIPQLRETLVATAECPVARLVADRLITLPTHYGITQVDIDRISRFLIAATN